MNSFKDFVDANSLNLVGTDRPEMKRKATEEKSKLPPCADYEPEHFIRCHSKDNDPNNNEVKVWRCAFEPVVGKPDESSNVLATCGGNIVCFIDCVTGKVLRRYKDNDKTETFYTLAWTSLPTSTDSKDSCNIVAAAGEGAAIKLIHPKQLVVFANVKAHRKYISCLLFHPKIPTLLFSGSHDGWIMLWEIGTVDLSQLKTDFRPILKIDVPNSEALNLVYSVKTNTLLAACEEGCYGWNLESKLKLSDKQRLATQIKSADYSFDLSSNAQQDKVDGLVILPGDVIATKCVGSRTIMLWNLDNCLGRGKRSKSIPVVPIAVLEYTQTEVEYLNMGYAHGILGVGDDLGNIYLYNVASLLKKSTVSVQEVKCPSRIIEWPELETDSPEIDEKELNDEEVVVNGVCVSSDAEYIAYGTDVNLVCILKRV